jgi:peroxiredoxin
MRHLASIEAQVTSTGIGRFSNLGFHGSLKLKKPNLGAISLVDAELPSPVKRVSDGKLMAFRLDNRQVVLQRASSDGDNLVGTTHCNEALFFFEPSELDNLRAAGTGIICDGLSRIGGVRCQVLKITGTPKGIVNRIYVGPQGVIYGTDNITERNGQQFGFRSRLTEVRLNPKFRASEFQLDAQFGKPVFTVGEPGPALRELRRMPNALKDGATMPKLSLTALDGHEFRLEEFLRSHKLTLLNFWSIYCAPCREELKAMHDHLLEWTNQGIGVLGVDSLETLTDVKKFWTDENYGFETTVSVRATPTIVGLVGFPTTFVIDQQGKIVTSIVGFSLPELQSAIELALGQGHQKSSSN